MPNSTTMSSPAVVNDATTMVGDRRQLDRLVFFKITDGTRFMSADGAAYPCILQCQPQGMLQTRMIG